MKDDRDYWLDKPENVMKIVWTLVAICTALLLADFFYHKHVHFGFERWFGFYALYGFIMCVALVLAAKAMRVVLMRREEYYAKDREDRGGAEPS